jgi:uncharacterized membrane protein
VACRVLETAFLPRSINSVLGKGERGMFEEVFASALYMLVMFFGVMIAFIILTGYYWSRQIRTIHLKKHAHNNNKDQHDYMPF